MNHYCKLNQGKILGILNNNIYLQQNQVFIIDLIKKIVKYY